MRFLIYTFILSLTACNKMDKVISMDEIVSFVGNPMNGYLLNISNSTTKCNILFRPPQYSAFIDCKKEFNDFSVAQFDSAVQKYNDGYFFEIHIESNLPKEVSQVQDTLYSELFIDHKSIMPNEIFEEPIMGMMNSRRFLVFFPREIMTANKFLKAAILKLKLGDNTFEINLPETLNLKFPMIINRS